MTHRIPNDKDERLEFLRHLHKLRNEINGENVKVKNRRFEKQYLHIKKLQDKHQLPFIDIPETINAGELGELVFRIDKKKGNIRILKRIYNSKNDEEEENKA